jgi:hypothetical protein
MLSILKNELMEFADFSKLKVNINKIYFELNSKNYAEVIEICDSCVELCERIKEKAVNITMDEEMANSMFVVTSYCQMLKYYSIFWQTLISGRFKDSWIVLQDTIDKLVDVTKFTDISSGFGINDFNNHLTELEKLYPYNLFASSEMVIRTKRCSICNRSVLDIDCIHIPGNLYWGQKAVTKNEDIEFQAVALVSHPMDKRCIMEISGDTRTEKEKFALLDYFVKQINNPLQLFSLKNEDRYYYNEDYDVLGRNDKCSCGSKKKFKKCCGKNKYEKGTHNKIILIGGIKLEPLRKIKEFSF